jgi:MFS family permease
LRHALRLYRALSGFANPARFAHHAATLISGVPTVTISRPPRLRLDADDLLRDPTYRRLWLSILISQFGGQVTMLALPLTAAILLHASPSQMGFLTGAEVFPYAVFSLPAGVWLDRIHKLPIYVLGELAIALAVTTVPLAWWLGWLSMPWLYLVGFTIGAVNTVSGSAAQIVLTQIVPRERLVEAHAKNALAQSGAEVAGPGAAGALIKVTGAPFALLFDAVMLLVSASILRGVYAKESVGTDHPRFWAAMRDGVDFVRTHRLLVAMAVCVGAWQMLNQVASVVQILVATRELGLGERAVGFCYIALGLGTVAASAVAGRISRRLGAGRTMVLGFGLGGAGWLVLAVARGGALGIAAYTLTLLSFGFGSVLIFVNFLALRQAVTPAPLLGRMTSTMRWLILLPAGPGALLGGWIGQHYGLRVALGVAGAGALVLCAVGSRIRTITRVHTLPGVRAEAVTP